MSYEGYEEFLCSEGHYWTIDAMSLMYAEEADKAKAMICSVPGCGKHAVYTASVDETNGVDQEVPETMPAPKIIIGHTDIPCQDHYGNKYFSKVDRYAPDFSNPRQHFKPCNTEADKEAEGTETVPMISVTASALYQLLHALAGPAHLIRELQATRSLDGVSGEYKNPINILVLEYNTWAANQHKVKEI